MPMKARFSAAVFAFVTVLTVLSSSIFLIEHADHDCAGADCPVCEQLYACAQNLKNLTAAVMTVMVMIALRFAVYVGVGQAKYAYAPHAPVNLKVKFSN